jgi:hypothetical protein
MSDEPQLTPEQVAEALPDILRKAGGGSCVMLHDEDGRAKVTFYKPGTAHEVAEDRSFLFIFAMSQRPGAMRFFHELEHTFFPPRSPLNEQFAMLFVYWQDLMFMGCRVPMDMQPCTSLTAQRTEMRIADGVPTMMGGGDVFRFPVNGPNVFTLENMPGSKVYQGMAAAEEMLKDEKMELNKEYEQE